MVRKMTLEEAMVKYGKEIDGKQWREQNTEMIDNLYGDLVVTMVEPLKYEDIEKVWSKTRGVGKWKSEEDL